MKTPVISPASETLVLLCLFYGNAYYRKFMITPAVTPRSWILKKRGNFIITQFSCLYSLRVAADCTCLVQGH